MTSQPQLQGKPLIESAAKLVSQQLSISLDKAKHEVSLCMDAYEYFDGEPTDPQWLANKTVEMVIRKSQ